MKSDAEYREELLRLGIRGDAVKIATGRDLDNIGNLVGILRDDPKRLVLPDSPPEFFSTEFVFPRHAKAGEVEMSAGGLTLRDYFAAQALLGIISGDQGTHMLSEERTSREAFAFADAMLEARKK